MLGSWYHNLLLLISCISFCLRLAVVIGGIIKYKIDLEQKGKTNVSVGSDCIILGLTLSYIIWYITQH